MVNKFYYLFVSVFCLVGSFLTFILLLSLNVINNFYDYIALIVNLIVIFSNLIFGIFIIKKTLKKENKKFLFEFFGSMILRVIFLLIFVFIALTIMKFPVSSFIFSFFGFYLFSLVFELSFLSRYLKTIFKVESKV